MAGLLDFLSGAPDLSSGASLGVDPATLQAFQQIRNQAQSAAIGPALIGGLMSALSGQRQGAGTRALEGAGRAYTGAEQRAEAQPIQMAQFAAAQRANQLKAQEAALNMQKSQESIDLMEKRGKALDWTMANKDKPMDSDRGKALFGTLLNSPSPEIAKAAQIAIDQIGTGKMTGDQANQFYTHLQKAQQMASSNSDVKLIGHQAPDDGPYTIYRFNKDGSPAGPPLVMNTGSPGGKPPKPKLATIYGPNGETKIEEVGAGYAPPDGWSLTKPNKAEDEAARQSKISSINARWSALHPYTENWRPEFQKAHAQALVDAGASQDEAKQLTGYKGKDLEAQKAQPAHAKTGAGLPAGSKANGDGTWTLPDGTVVKPK